MAIEMKRGLKLYRHKQKICIQPICPWYIFTDPAMCPIQKSEGYVKRMILTLEPCWLILQRDYLSHSQVCIRVELVCL